MSEQKNLGTLLDSYAKVLRAHIDMDLSKICERDRKNLLTLLVDRPDIGHRTIIYLIDSLQDAAEKRMSAKYSYRIDTPVASFVTVTAGYDVQLVNGEPEVTIESDVAEAGVISLDEARRRAAVANMLIAECEASDALNDAFKEGLTPDKTGPRADPRPVWHSRNGWLTHPIKQVQTLDEAVEAGDITRSQAAASMGQDIEVIDAENARDEARAAELGLPKVPTAPHAVIDWYSTTWLADTVLVGFYNNQKVCQIRKLNSIHVVDIGEEFPIHAPFAGSTYFCGSVEAGKAIADEMLQDALKYGNDISRYRTTRSF